MRRLIFTIVFLAGCNGTTGSGLVTFTARAGGPSDVVPGQPLVFKSGFGFDISLTTAHFHLGAIYLNMNRPSSGLGQQPCVLPGIYDGQAFAALDLDLLSPALVTFPSAGQGTANPVAVGEVWLTGGDINATEDETVILDVAGTATRGNDAWPFVASVTIGSNRAIPPPNAGMPGANPICHQRIAGPICGAPTSSNACPPLIPMLSDGGTLELRIDPRGMFNSVDFTQLAPNGSATTVTIPDTSAGTGYALFKGVIANSGVYDFTWTPKGH
jgi:hypothetical protein